MACFFWGATVKSSYFQFQARLSTFFENLGWKVYRVPETANILLSGGVNFTDLSPEASEKFQVKFQP